jgi:hypothetical protein
VRNIQAVLDGDLDDLHPRLPAAAWRRERHAEEGGQVGL